VPFLYSNELACRTCVVETLGWCA